MRKQFLLLVVLICSMLVPLSAQVTQFPLTEGFESTTFPDNGWTTASTATGSYYQWTRTTGYQHTGSASAYVGSTSVGTLQTLTSPALAFASGVQYEVRFWMYRYYSSYYATSNFNEVRVFTSSIANDTTSATLIGAVHNNPAQSPVEGTTSGWFLYSFNIPLNTTDSFIIFAYSPSGYGAPFAIDDITIREVPSCQDLSGTFSVTGKTTSSLVVTISDTTANRFDVGYRVKGTSTPWTFVTSAAGALFDTITGLTSGTYYSLITRRYCSATDQSALSDTIVACTSCDPISIPTTGWSDDFEGEPVGLLEGCYVGQDAVGPYSHYYAAFLNQQSSAHSGSQYFTSIYTTTSTSPSSFSAGSLGMFRQFHLVAGQNYQIGIYAKKYNSSYTDYSYNLDFYYGVDTATLTNVGTVSVSNTAYTNYVVYFQPTTTGDYYVGFKAGKSSGSCYVYADDYSIRPINVMPPTGVAASNVTATSATISFTNSQPSAELVIDTVEADVTLGRVLNQTGITSSPVNITNLDPHTTYYYAMRAINGTDTSIWSVTSSFTTEYLPSTVPYTEDFESYTAATRLDARWTQTAGATSYLYSSLSGTTYNHTENGTMGISLTYEATSSYAGSSSGDRLLAQKFTLDSGKYYRVALYAKKYNSSYTDYSYKLSIGVGSSIDSITYGSEITIDGTDWAEYADYITVSADGDYYIAFLTKHGNYSYYYSYIDDISITEVTVMPPSGISAQNITSNSAEIAFVPNAPATQLVVSDDEENVYAGNTYNIDTLTVSPASVTSLTPDTYYYYALRSINGTDTSVWSSVHSFHTECLPVDSLPYLDDFEEADQGLLAGCYSQNVIGTKTINVLNNSACNHTAEGTQGISVSSGAGSTTSASAYYYDTLSLSRQFSLIPGHIYEVSIYAKRSTSSYFTDYNIHFAISNQGQPLDLTGNYLKTCLVSNTAWAKKSAFFSVSDTAIYNVGLVTTVPSSYTYIYMDDYAVREITCPTPDVYAAAVGVDNATLNINTGAGNYQVVCDTLPIDVADLTSVMMDTMVTLSDNTLQLDSLAASRTYYVALRKFCSAIDTSDWAESISFTTAYAICNVPYTDDFESYADSTAMPASYYPFIANTTSSYYGLYTYSDSLFNHTAGGSKGIVSAYATSSYSSFPYQLSYAVGFSQLFHLNAGTYEVSLAAKGYNSYAYPVYEFYAGTTRDYSDTKTNTKFATFTVNGGLNWNVMTATFTVDTVGDYYVNIVAPNNSSSRYIIFDDFSVRALTSIDYNDRVAAFTDYNNHGFYVYASDLVPGTDTLLTRRVYAAVDTIINVNLHVCEPTLYVVDTTYNCDNWVDPIYGRLPAGNYDFVDTLRYVSCGCDSVITYTHLTVYPTYADTAEYVLTSGETYYWHGQAITKAGTYNDTLLTDVGCDSVFTLNVTVVTGLDNLADDANITLAPNPVSVGATALIYCDFNDVTTVEILNNLGQVICSFTPASYPIAVPAVQAPGLYYVRLTTASGNVHLQKLMVK